MERRPLLLSLCAMLLLSVSCGRNSSIADNDYDVAVAKPLLKASKPTVCFDESHKNHHKISTTYKPFSRLIANDGCRVGANAGPISHDVLAHAAIYVIPTAMGREDPGATSPFTTAEMDVFEKWVKGGGAALIITEHYPFGIAMAPLLNRFGVTVHNGFTEDAVLDDKKVADALLFEKSKGNLNASHPIFNGVERIDTFTGSSIKGDSGWDPLLIFSTNGRNYNVRVTVKRSGGDVTTSVEYTDFYPATGYSQGICKQYGKGRVVVLAESALLTAQIDKNGNKFGINVPDRDNRQFALNVIRWLAAR